MKQMFKLITSVMEKTKMRMTGPKWLRDSSKLGQIGQLRQMHYLTHLPIQLTSQRGVILAKNAKETKVCCNFFKSNFEMRGWSVTKFHAKGGKLVCVSCQICVHDVCVQELNKEFACRKSFRQNVRKYREQNEVQHHWVKKKNVKVQEIGRGYNWRDQSTLKLSLSYRVDAIHVMDQYLAVQWAAHGANGTIMKKKAARRPWKIIQDVTWASILRLVSSGRNHSVQQ